MCFSIKITIMENNNDPSTGSGTNKNKKIEELSDEQLKEVAGGIGIEIIWAGLCNFSTSFGCQNYDTEQCKCLD